MCCSAFIKRMLEKKKNRKIKKIKKNVGANHVMLEKQYIPHQK